MSDTPAPIPGPASHGRPEITDELREASPYDLLTEREDIVEEADLQAEKAEAAVHRMERGEPMSEAATTLLEEGKASIRAAAGLSEEAVDEANNRFNHEADP